MVSKFSQFRKDPDVQRRSMEYTKLLSIVVNFEDKFDNNGENVT